MERRTTDIGLAAALVAAGHRIIRIESDGMKGTFFFDQEAAEDISRYFDGDLTVPARKMFEEIKILKGRVRSL